MPLDNFKNIAEFTLSLGYDASATSIVLTADPGAACPTAPANAWWYNATDFPNPKDDPNYEIVRLTARAGATLTITRAQEGTSASTKNTAGKTYKLCFGLTAKTLNNDIPSEFSARDSAIAAAQSDATAAQAGATSAQADLAVSTGTGDLVRKNSPTLVTPTIASMANANHNHQNGAGGGTLVAAALLFAATQRLLARNTAGAGPGEEVTLSQLLDWIGAAAQGDILYRGAAAWTRLAAGTSGHFLQTLGAGANPQWAAASGSSTRSVKRLAADHSLTSTTTLADINDLPTAIAASKKYRFRAWLIYAQAGGSANLKLSITGPASPTLLIYHIPAQTSSSAWVLPTASTAYGTSNAQTTGTTAGRLAIIEGFVDNGANAGNLAPQFAQNVSDANATTIKAGSIFEVEEVP